MYIFILLISNLVIALENGNPPYKEVESLILFTPKEVVFDTEGLFLLKKHCYACHNPNTASHDEIIAPPLEGIKSHYMRRYPEKNRFSEAMESFVKNPQIEKALMKGPVNRFGLMPKPVISEDELNKIIIHIRDQKLEVPVWWTDHTSGR